MRDEISEVIGDGEDFTLLDLEKLIYMGYVLKEVLRVFPPVATVARRTACETTLGEYVIPEDVCCLYALMTPLTPKEDHYHHFTTSIRP